MTLENAIELANSGDHNAIITLGNYYISDDDNPDYIEAHKWYTYGAKLGFSDCMHLASISGYILGRASRKITGSAGIEEAIEYLDEAMHWAKQASNDGISEAHDQINPISGELGIAYYLLGIREDSAEELLRAINLLKPIYKTVSDKEVTLYLGFALYHYGKLVGNIDSLTHQLLAEIVDNHFDAVTGSDAAAVHLGIMYTEGCGCKVDYNKAVYYFQKAHNAGLDCSDMLSLFKKKLFGGYTLID